MSKMYDDLEKDEGRSSESSSRSGDVSDLFATEDEHDHLQDAAKESAGVLTHTCTRR